jgi:hypothetical protein
MKNTRLIIRLMGLAEARAEGTVAAVMLTALAVLGMALLAYRGSETVRLPAATQPLVPFREQPSR